MVSELEEDYLWCCPAKTLDSGTTTHNGAVEKKVVSKSREQKAVREQTKQPSKS